MRWKDGRRSSNVEDRRGRGGGFPGGFRFPLPRSPRAGLPGGMRVGLPRGPGMGYPRGARSGGIGCLGLLLLALLFMVLFDLRRARRQHDFAGQIQQAEYGGHFFRGLALAAETGEQCFALILRQRRSMRKRLDHQGIRREPGQGPIA